MTSLDLSEFLSGFLQEADEHLRSVNANLLLVDTAIQSGVPNPRAVRELFRSLHTIKGLAGMVGIEPIVDIAHAMERLLRSGQQSGGRIPSAAFEPLLQGANAIAQRVRSLAEGRDVAAAPKDLLEALGTVEAETRSDASPDTLLDLDEALVSKLNAAEKEQLAGASAIGKRAYAVPFTPSAERAKNGISITTIRERVGRIAEIVKVIPTSAPKEQGSSLTFLLFVVTSEPESTIAELAQCSPDEVRVISRARAPLRYEEPDPGTSSNYAPGMLRVEVKRVDAAMDGLAELLVTRFRLTRAIDELAARGVDVRGLRQIAYDSARQLRDMRSAILGLRMVSLAELFERLPILVRGLRASTRKPVELTLDVGRVEVDKAVGERLWPVLVHLIRNAVDHGIESEAERARAHKPPVGRLSVSCVEIGSSQIQITVEDDGAGIDAERVARRAQRAVPQDDASLLEVLTTPGFSTREVANATSGRGMGLDIARRIVVEELAGDIALSTSKGEGTRFTLQVPITIALVDTFRFESAAQQFLVPVASVHELVDVDGADVVQTPALSNALFPVALFHRRGTAMPLVELSTVLGQERRAPSSKAIIVRRSEQLFAFGVDRLLDHHEVVVRPLSDPLVDVPGVSGSADLGDGRPTLLLDLVALAAKLTNTAEQAA